MKFSIKNFKLGNVFRNVSSKVKTGNVNKLVDGIKKVNKSFDQASRSLNASKEYNFNGIETIPYSDTKDSNSGSSSVNATGPTTAVIAVYNECINLIKSNKSFDINNVNDNSSRKCTFLCEQNAPGLKKKLKKYINDNYGKTWHASILNDNVIKALVNLNKNMINSNNTIRELNGRAASVPSSKLSEEDEKKSEENSFAGMQTPLEAYKNMLEKQRKESPPSPPVRTKKKSDETLQHHAEVDARHTSVKSDFNSHTDATNGSTELNGSDKNANKLSSKALPGQNKTAEPVKVSQHHAEGGAEHTSATSGKRDFKSPSSATNDSVDLNVFDQLEDELGFGVSSKKNQTTKLTKEELDASLDNTMELLNSLEGENNIPKNENKPKTGSIPLTVTPAGKKVVVPSPTTNSATKPRSTPSTVTPAEKKVTASEQNANFVTTGEGNFRKLAGRYNKATANKSDTRVSPKKGTTLPQQHHRPLPLPKKKGKSATLNHVPTTSSEKEKTLLQNFGKATIIINNIKNIKEKSKDLETIYNLVRKDITPYAADESMAALYNDIAEAVSYYMEYAKLDDSALFNNYKKLGMVIDKFKNNWNDIPENAQGLVGGLIELREKMTPPPVPARQSVSQPPAPQTSSTPAAPQTSSVPPAPPLPKREVEKQAESSADAPAPQVFSTSATSSAPPAPPAPSAPAAPAAQMSSTPGSTSTIANELQKVKLRKTPSKDEIADTDTGVVDMTTLLRNGLRNIRLAVRDDEEEDDDNDEWSD